MRRFLWQVGLFVSLQIFLLLIVLAKGGSDAGGYMGAIVDKHQRFSSARPPRFVFVGGSAMAFSLDGKSLEERLRRSVVNLGLHAGLGLSFILDDVPVSQLGHGDLVVLNLEYEHYCRDEAMVDVVFEAVKARPSSAWALSGRTVKKLLDEGLALPTTYFNQWVAILKRREGSSHPVPTPYQRKGFDLQGDVVAHLDLPVSRAAVEHHIETRNPLILSEPYLDQVLTLLNAFAVRCRQHGATVVLIYPVYPKSLFERNRAVIERIDAAFRQRLDVPVLGKPEESVAPVDYFYDTHYHLNREGVQWRTATLATALEAKVNPDSNRVIDPAANRIGQFAPSVQ